MHLQPLRSLRRLRSRVSLVLLPRLGVGSLPPRWTWLSPPTCHLAMLHIDARLAPDVSICVDSDGRSIVLPQFAQGVVNTLAGFPVPVRRVSAALGQLLAERGRAPLGVVRAKQCPLGKREQMPASDGATRGGRERTGMVSSASPRDQHSFTCTGTEVWVGARAEEQPQGRRQGQGRGQRPGAPIVARGAPPGAVSAFVFPAAQQHPC